MGKIAMLYVTFSGEEEARTMADLLLDQGLVACANTFPSESRYFWEGKLQSDAEWIGIFKTRPELSEKVSTLIIKKHAYELPCILMWDVEANDAYHKWVSEQTI